MRAIDKFTRETFTNHKQYYCRPEIVCNDGFKMSVQGNTGHYSTPRSNEKEFTAMEIGFPSSEEYLIIEYAERKEMPTQTVYGWVPIETIEEVIIKHGGINIELTFNK
jgi:hypothetical protein